MEAEQVRARLALIRYLLSQADGRGKTHGEKHYYIQVALAEIVALIVAINPGEYVGYNQSTHLDKNDIPF